MMNKVLHADMQLSTRSVDAGQPIFFLPWMADTIVYLQTEAATL